MGLINWSKDEEYEEALRQYHRNRSKEYYQKNRDKCIANAQKYRQAKREVNIFKKWSDIYTEDEIDQILQYIQKEMEICKKKNILNMRAWWSNFKSYAYNDAKINLTDAGEFFCFMDTLKFKRGYENVIICEKAKKYYFYVSNEKLIKVYGELDTRNAKENERVKNYYLSKKKEKYREQQKLYREQHKEYFKNYRETHKEEMRQYKQEHRERIKEQKRLWAIKNRKKKFAK